MELKKQVCSLGLAKKFKQLGVKQESHFYWARIGGIDRLTDNKNLNNTVHGKHWHFAFTVTELGEMLSDT